MSKVDAMPKREGIMSDPTISSPSREGVETIIERLRRETLEDHGIEGEPSNDDLPMLESDTRWEAALALESLLSKEKDRTVQGGEWRADEWGQERRALYIGGLYVGGVIEWRRSGDKRVEMPYRAWFMNAPDGNDVGWFSTQDEARAAVEAALRAALPREAGPSTPDPQTRKDDWIPWNGGECPVPRKARVEYRMREFPNNAHTSPADELDWNHHGEGFDIIAYRPVPTGERE